MQVQHKSGDGKGCFYVKVDNDILAKLTYAQTGKEQMLLEHTEVDDELRGKNVGYQMVTAAVSYARQHNLKIIPICPFVQSVFEKKPDYADVLEEN